MTNQSLTIFRDFLEDQRISMDVYADNLTYALREYFGDVFDVVEYQPTLPGWVRCFPENSSLRMRTARYLAYPLQARRAQRSINHIIDHGYAHLVHAISSKHTVVTVHDLIPLLAWHGKIPGMSYPHQPLLNKFSLKALHKAAYVISDSASTKNDLIEYVGLASDKIEVIHLGLDERFRPLLPEHRQMARKSFGLPNSEAHVVLITGRQLYKNHKTSLRVIERLQSLCKKPIQLVRLGAETPEWAEQLSQSRLHSPVKILRGLTTEQLVELYNSIDCLLFPSWYEGFGWPPLEAMACGVPVVTSNVGSLPEVVGGAALTAAPDDVNALSNAVHAMLERSDLRNDHIQRGLKNVTRFTWQQCAHDVAKIYRKILRKQQ